MGQADSKSKTIDGVEYHVHMLDPFTAADMANDVARIMTPLLGGAMGLKDLQGLMDKEADPQQLAVLQTGLGAFFKEFTKEQQREIMSQLSKVTMVKRDGALMPLEEVFLIHFTGKIGAMYQWLAFALKVQFEDLFKGLGTVISRAVPIPQPE